MTPEQPRDSYVMLAKKRWKKRSASVPRRVSSLFRQRSLCSRSMVAVSQGEALRRFEFGLMFGHLSPEHTPKKKDQSVCWTGRSVRCWERAEYVIQNTRSTLRADGWCTPRLGWTHQPLCRLAKTGASG